MKVFLSWSGDESRHFAEQFKDLLEQVLPWTKVYLSDVDIESGERWLSNVAGNLEEANFGVIFLTSKNKTAPWILFEAGALSKNLDDARVVPLLCDLSDIDLTGNPLSHFQYRKLVKDDVAKIIRDISRRAEQPASWERLARTFDMFWPEYERGFLQIRETAAKGVEKPVKESTANELKRMQRSMDEVLALLRMSQISSAPPHLSSVNSDDGLSFNFIRRVGGERRVIARLNGRRYIAIIAPGATSAELKDGDTEEAIGTIVVAEPERQSEWRRAIRSLLLKG